MSRGQNPLVLMMALSLPGAAHALGLGEIHVNSALNEPLAADIEIVGATPEELSSLTASVANKETFLRFGAERPAFLATATFKVSRDVKGKPVLVIRSSDSFTEPVVNLLVDLRWHSGEVIRQYSLLLDPAGFPAATQLAAAVRAPVMQPAALALPAPAAAISTTLTASVGSTASAASNTRTTTHMKIGAKATLRGIAWRVGARSDSDIKKTMLAIFRANPHAFEGNINRLHLGAVLTIPSAAEISTISKEDAGREIRAQMTAWRASPPKVRTAAAAVQGSAAMVQATPAPLQAKAAAVQSMAEPVQEMPPQARAVADTAASTDTAALNLRVQTLEQGLHDVQGQLEREHNKLLTVQSEIRYAAQAVNDPVAAAAAPRHWLPTSLAAGIALLAGAFGAMFLVQRRRETAKANPASPTLAGGAPTAETPHAAEKAAAQPAPREALRTMPRPLWQDAIELSAARNSVDDSETESGEPNSAAVNPEAPPKPTFTVNEDELRAAYEDTLDLSAETAVLANDIASAGGETANLPAATVNLNAHALQAAAAADSTAVYESAVAEESANSEQSAAAEDSVTAIVGAEELRVDTTQLDYNLVDLDLTAQHVHMPSVLHERVVVKERRTNLVDVLKKAVEREPDRSDLRMKLLETYYAAAAANRHAFLEVVQKLARNRDRLDEGEWEKIAHMGKQIAADAALFSSDSEAEDDKLADCA